MACLKLAATRVYALGFLSDGSSAPCAVGGWNLSGQDWCWCSSGGEVGSVLGLERSAFSGKVDVSMTRGAGGGVVLCRDLRWPGNWGMIPHTLFSKEVSKCHAGSGCLPIPHPGLMEGFGG